MFVFIDYPTFLEMAAKNNWPPPKKILEKYKERINAYLDKITQFLYFRR